MKSLSEALRVCE
jgi:hypothetical protein